MPALSSNELFSAIKENQKDIVASAILEKDGIDLSAKNAEGQTPIVYAAKHNKWEFVDLLLQYPSEREDIYKVDFGIALHYAVMHQHYESARKLLAKGAPTVAYVSEAKSDVIKPGFYPLHTAVKLKNLPLVTLLLEYKANPSIKPYPINDTYLMTPVELAVAGDQANMIKVLLEARADTTVKDSQDHTPIVQAAILQHWKCVEKLLFAESTIGSFALVLKIAVDHDQEDIVAILAAHKVPFDGAYEKKSGFYALHSAVRNNNLPIIKLLLDNKADPSIKTKMTKDNSTETTPLQVAVNLNKHQTIPLLILANADPSIKNSENRTPIVQAAISGHWECVEHLLIPSLIMDSASLGLVLHHAVCAKENKYAELLIQSGAQFDESYNEKNGFTVLHEAAASGNFEMVRCLVMANADPLTPTKITSENHDSKTAIQVAIEHERKEIAEYLDKKAETPDKIFSKNFVDVNSFIEIHNKLHELSKKHKLKKLFMLSTHFSQNTMHFFKLSYLILILKEKYKDQFGFLKNVGSFFQSLPPESHVYIARAILNVIEQTFEYQAELEVSTKETLRALFKIKTPTEAKADMLPTEKELKQLAVKYSSKIAIQIYSHQSTHYLKNKICQIAASEYLQDTIQNKVHVSSEIRKQLEFLFNKDIYKRGFFKESFLSSVLNGMIQFFGKNRKTTSLLPIKPSGTQENFEDSRAELSNLELPRPSVSEISYSQIFKGLPTSASLQAPLSPQSLASLMEPSQIGSEASDLLFEEKPKSPVSIADSHLTTMTLFKQSDAFSEEGSSVTDSMRKLSFN